MLQGWVAWERGELPRAIELDDAALKVLRQVGDALSYAQFKNFRGELARSVGDLDRAWEAYQEALRAGLHLGCKRFILVANLNLAKVAFLRSEWKAAAGHIRAGLSTSRELGERQNLSSALMLAARGWSRLETRTSLRPWPELPRRSLHQT
jgi:tetratricopeptide (TPR) repeat protein